MERNRVSKITLYHNPNCSKSRGAKEILEARGVPLTVVEYLKNPPTVEELTRLLERLEDAPDTLVRQDGHFKELGLDPTDYTTVAAVAALLAEHPKLMQRPVAVLGERAMIARPPELVEELL